MKEDLVLSYVENITTYSRQRNQTTTFTIAFEQKHILFVTSQIGPEDETKHWLDLFLLFAENFGIMTMNIFPKNQHSIRIQNSY